MWLPRKATYEHPACIRAITYSPELGVIVQEVGAGVERDPEDTLEGILWEFGHDIPLSQLPELQDLFE